jgi:hypothetical protein
MNRKLGTRFACVVMVCVMAALIAAPAQAAPARASLDQPLQAQQISGSAPTVDGSNGSVTVFGYLNPDSVYPSASISAPGISISAGLRVVIQAYYLNTSTGYTNSVSNVATGATSASTSVSANYPFISFIGDYSANSAFWGACSFTLSA